MDDGIKQRLIGAIFLVAVMVIFLPMFFANEEIEPLDILIEMPEKPPVPDFDISKPVKPSELGADEQVTDKNPPAQVESPGIVAQVIEKSPPPQIEPLEKSDRAELKDKTIDAQGLPVSWVLQVASFKDQANAEKLRDKLRKDSYKAYIENRPDVEPQMVRVFVGPVLERKAIDKIKTTISSQYKLDGVVVRYLP